MKFSVINSTGSVTSSGSTDGSGGGSGKSMLGPFTFWSPQNDCPTSYTNMNYPLVGWNNSSVATMNAGVKMGSAGYINSLATNVNGQTGGINIGMQVYKNGVATGLLTTTAVSNGGPVTPNSQAGGAGFSFAVGDLISVYIQAASSGVNQSFSAFLELVLS